MPAEENSPIEGTVRGLIITSSVEDCIFSILYLVPTSVGVSIGMTDLNVCYQRYILCILTTEVGGRVLGMKKVMIVYLIIFIIL